MKLLDRVTVEPGKCGGRPCIRGLRIRVTDVLGMLAEGVPHEEILRDFPYLEPDDIKAALAWLEPLWPDAVKRLEQGEKFIELRA
jgi:uncharacterized protein (DUF433 family)